MNDDKNSNIDSKNIRTLCDICAKDYFSSPDFYIKAVYPKISNETCSKCNKKGYDFVIKDKSNNN